MEDSIKAFAYTRASTNVQERINNQTASIKEYAEDNNIEILHWYDDYLDDKQALQAMLDDVASGAIGDVSLLIVDTPDRVSRSAKELYVTANSLSENNVSITFASKTPSDFQWLTLQMMNNVRENYAYEFRKERAKAAMKRKFEVGLYPLRPPFGYQASGTKNLYQPTDMAKVFGEYLQKTANKEITIDELHTVAKKLLVSKKSISLKKLKEIALNPFYAGITRFGGVSYQGSRQAILSVKDQKQLEELFA